MTKFTKYFINNLSKSTYFKNINNVTPALEVKDDSSNVPTYAIKDSFNNIKYYSEYLRERNLKIFTKNFIPIKIKKFFVITLPATLTALTIGSFILPTHGNGVRNFKTYTCNETLLSSTRGEADIETTCYEATTDKELRDHADYNFIYNPNNYVKFRITDGVDSIVANFSLSDDGSLTISKVEHSDVLDTRLTDTEFSSINPDYEHLFDEILEIVKNSSYISQSELEILEKLNSSEKKELIVDIYKYKYLGKEKLGYVSSMVGWRIFLVIVTILDILFTVLCSVDSNNKCSGVTIDNDGKLREDDREEVGLFYASLYYKQAFMKAEELRIHSLYKELMENVVPEDQEKILTRFERNLIKK